MSTVRADNFSDRAGSGSITAQTLLNGPAKVWYSLNGTGTIAPRDSFNVSSFVDSGVGVYTSNFSSVLLNSNYEFSGFTGIPGYGIVFHDTGYSRGVATISIGTVYVTSIAGSVTAADYQIVNLAVLGHS